MKNQTLQSVNERLIETGQFLEDITLNPEKLQCLQTFARCREVIKWIREVTKSQWYLVQFSQFVHCIFICYFVFFCLIRCEACVRLVLRLLYVFVFVCVCVCVHLQLSRALSYVIPLLCQYSHERSRSYWKFAGSIGQGYEISVLFSWIGCLYDFT